jgi:hypothetical protein
VTASPASPAIAAASDAERDPMPTGMHSPRIPN